MTLGLISDTHDFLDPQIARRFKGVDHILHAGDIGSPFIIHELELIAPVKAVSGNTDDPSHRYPDTRFVTFGGKKFFIQHIVNPMSLDPELRDVITRESPDVVLFGHTHKRFAERIGGTWFINPGYSGRPKNGTARSIATLDLRAPEISPKFIAL